MKLTITIGVSLLIGSVLADANDAIVVGGVTSKPGQVISGYINIEPRSDDGVSIPVSVIQGVKDGPTLALIAGTHGFEYPGITALQRVRGDIDAKALSGTVIMVHIANPPSFYGRTIYYSPVDGENLNRVYPGKADGTLSQRIAYAITKDVIEQADFMIDLHGGDGNEALRPYVYMPVTGDKVLDEKCRQLAIAFGLDHIVIDEGRMPDPENSLYTDHTALARGVAAITSETGQLGSNDDHWVSLAETGIWNVMRHLQMVSGAVTENKNIVWLTDYQVLRSPENGIFEAAVRDGYAIADGGRLGTLYDAFGDKIQDIRSPFAGVVNYVIGTPPVSKGEPVAMVSKVKATN